VVSNDVAAVISVNAAYVASYALRLWPSAHTVGTPGPVIGLPSALSQIQRESLRPVRTALTQFIAVMWLAPSA